MFRRLRERLAEELEAQATRFPGGQHAFNNNPGGKATDSATKCQEETSPEDLITLSDSPSVVVPHTSPQQFSIGDDDGFPSQTSTPQRKQANSSDLDQYYSPNSSADQPSAPLTEVQNILPTYTPSKRSFYVPQSDIESEVEEPPTLKLDGISMDQLSATNEVLKAKLYKYKDKYTKIVQAYKEMIEEKKKIEHTLTECQDKALRRIAELKEQCQLEQKAKAHLEENLRIYLEEKEEMINVLQTKIELLKEGRNIDAPEIPVQEKDPSDEDTKSEETSSGHNEDENIALRDKVKKLQALLEKCKETIVNSKEQMVQLVKEKENMSQMLEAKTKEAEELKARESQSQSELEVQLRNLQSRLTELEQQQAESAMSMAETKKNMHEELEIKEQQVTKAKEDIKQLQHAVDHERNLTAETKKQHEETIDKLQNKLKITEKLMEEEKQNLMQELSRGKAAAVTLMQQECAKKLTAVEAEWKDRLKESEIQSEKDLHEKEKEVNEMISQKEVEFQNLQRDCEKHRLTAEEMERQNEKLSEAIESMRAGTVTENELVMKMNCLKADHLRDIEEKNLLISSLECDKSNMHEELEKLKAKINELQNEVAESQQSIMQLKEQLRNCEIVISERDSLIEKFRNTIQNVEEMVKNTLGFASLNVEQQFLQSHLSHGNDLKELLLNNDSVMKLIISSSKEVKEKLNCLVVEKEKLEKDMNVSIAEMKRNLDDSSEYVTSLQQNLQDLELKNSGLSARCKELQEKVGILEENENIVRELEHKLEEETKKGIENASKHYSLLQSFLEMVQQLDNEFQQNTHEVSESQEEKSSSVGELCSGVGKTQDLATLCHKLEQELNERLAQAAVIKKQLKGYKDEVAHLKSGIEKCESINGNLCEKLQASEKRCSQMVIEQESSSSEISRLQELLSISEEKSLTFQDDVQKLTHAFEEVNYRCEYLEKENAHFIQEVNSLRLSVNELKLENENLTATVELLKNTSDSKVDSFVREISSLQQSLMKTREERNNLSAVLMSVEQEMGLNTSEKVCETSDDNTDNSTQKEFPSGSLDDKDYVKRIEEMKALIKDLQYRETEQSNLLEKTRNDYENQIKQINMKVQDEVKTLNALTERSSNELHCLKKQFAVSQKEYEEKIEQLNNKLNTKSDEVAALMEDLNSKTAGSNLLENKVKTLQDALIEKEALLSALQQDKNDLERKVEEVKENCEQQEYELKARHNLILTDLRDQTKQTIDTLNLQIKELNETLKGQEDKHEALIVELKALHQSEMDAVKNRIHELELDSKYVSDTEEKLRNIQNCLDSMTCELEEVGLQRDKEVEAKLTAQEESREWETKFKGLSLQMLSTSAAHMEDCASLQSVIEQKEGQVRSCKQNLASVSVELHALREKLNELAEGFIHAKQDYESQVQDMKDSLKKTEVVASKLLQRLMHAENTFAKKTAVLHKSKQESEEKWKNKIASVNKKFIDQLKKQQEKHKMKLQQLETLLNENASLKTSLKEKESILSHKESSMQEYNEKMIVKDKQIEDLQYALAQKEDSIVLSCHEKEEVFNNLTNIKEENASLNEILSGLQVVYKTYAADELSPAGLSSLLQDLHARCKAFEVKSMDLENALSSLELSFSDKISSKDQHIEEIKNDLNNALGNISSLETNCKAFQEEISSLREHNRLMLDEKEKELKEAEENIANLKSLFSEANNQSNVLGAKLQNFEENCSEREKGYLEKISNLTLENEKIRNEQKLAEEEFKKKMGALKKKAELKLAEIKKNLEDEKHEYLMAVESGYKEEFTKLTEKINVLEAEKKFEKKKAQEIEEVKQEMNVKLEELRNQLTLQLQTKNEEHEAVLSQQTKLQTDCSILQESVKDKENIILQLKSTVSSAEKENQCEIEEMNAKIKQLELEREHLMLQAQERVAATEAKCRDNINSLTEKISELQSKEREIGILKSDIEKLNSQLDESLIVAEANQSAAAQELSILKAHLSTTQKELEDAVKAHSLREAELLNQVKSLESDMLCLQKDKSFEAAESEKVVLLERIKNLEEKIENHSVSVSEIHGLKEENERLQSEINALVALQKDNETLIAKVHSLESNEKDLLEKLSQLEVTNAELRTSVPNSVKQSSDEGSSDIQKELAHLQNENRALLDKVRVLEESISKNSDPSFTEYVELIKRDYEGKLSAKDAEMESKLKQIIKDFAAQMNVKEKDYDEILSQVLENSQSQEGKLLREHRLEIASLRQEIFEKDCALEEMHDHYEEIVKEKDAKLKELEKKCISSSTKHGSEPTSASNETSDWDDNWVECEENCDNASPVHSSKGDCATHVQQIHMLQEELEKCNSEIKDLRVLLRLSPPQSLASNNDSKTSSLLLPEPTEFEYLKNILFEYMMGKEPLTLAKVIAAVLRFSDEQTKLVLKKEELKQTMK